MQVYRSGLSYLNLALFNKELWASFSSVLGETCGNPFSWLGVQKKYIVTMHSTHATNCIELLIHLNHFHCCTVKIKPL